MQHILSRRSRPVLKRFAEANTLLGFDFDGTLAPIVADRHRAVMRRSTKTLLARLAARYPCVVISGRARKDVLARLRGVGMRGIVGNHGIEPWSSLPALERKVRGWVSQLRRSLQHLAGVAVEDKRFSVTVHYRRAHRKAQALTAIRAAARGLGALRVVGGKQVVNILPAGAPHKGTALQRELRKLRCERAIYTGDDDTDEDVFSLSRPARLLTVRVGRKSSSRARYYVRSQREIDRFLRTLLELRRK